MYWPTEVHTQYRPVAYELPCWSLAMGSSVEARASVEAVKAFAGEGKVSAEAVRAFAEEAKASGVALGGWSPCAAIRFRHHIVQRLSMRTLSQLPSSANPISHNAQCGWADDAR